MKEYGHPPHIAESLKHTILTKAETAELIGKSQRGDKKATEKLVKHNMRFVYMIARRYSFALPIEDLIQEGVCGLLKAISEFRLSTNYSLSTYSKLWVIAYCKRAAQKNSGFSAFQTAGSRHVIRVERTLSIDSDLVGDDMTIGDTLEDEGPLPDEELFHKEIRQNIQRVLRAEVYSDPRSELIARRLADRDSPDLTLEKLGNKLGVSRERVRQLEVKVIKRIKYNKNLKKLAESA